MAASSSELYISKLFTQMSPIQYVRYSAQKEQVVVQKARFVWGIIFSKSINELQIQTSFSQITSSHKIEETKEFQQDLTLLTKGRLVGWDGGSISQIPDGDLLFSEQFGPCIAILMRGFQSSSKTPSHVGIIHVYSQKGIEEFEKRLNEIAQLAKARIELFIAGGDNSTRNNLEKIQKVVSSYQERVLQDPDASEVVIQDNLFGLRKPFVEGRLFYRDNEVLYSGSVGIKTVGFDRFFNPFLVLDANFSGLKVQTLDPTRLKV